MRSLIHILSRLLARLRSKPQSYSSTVGSVGSEESRLRADDLKHHTPAPLASGQWTPDHATSPQKTVRHMPSSVLETANKIDLSHVLPVSTPKTSEHDDENDDNKDNQNKKDKKDQKNKKDKDDVVFSRDPEQREAVDTLLARANLKSGTQRDKHALAIINLLGRDLKTMYAAVRALRWPEVVHCPRCGSSRVRRRPAPPETADLGKWFYTCLNCEEEQTIAEFDDTFATGLPENPQELRRWLAFFFMTDVLTPTQAIKLLGSDAQFLLASLSDNSQQFREVLLREQTLKKEADLKLRERKKRGLAQNKTKK